MASDPLATTVPGVDDHDLVGSFGGAEAMGHDPRSTYAERYWLPVIGPSSLVCARSLFTGWTHPTATRSTRMKDLPPATDDDQSRTFDALADQ